ncbi:MAG: acyltransferase family protein [Gemmataceae bacterium]
MEANHVVRSASQDPIVLRAGRGAYSAPDYLPQLDGIRAVAIFAVMLAHFLPIDFLISRVAQWGRLGVVLFFTLSGFLITGILLGYRDFSASGRGSPWTGLRVFYIRRFLRIFPVYYLTLGVLALGGYQYVRQYFLWHVSYTSNISIAHFGGLYGYSVHLWSLCVEEQFYLIWPCLVIFTPKRALGKVTLGVIAGSLVFKTVGSLAGMSAVAATFTLFGCLDSLALGALLAICRHEGWVNSKTLARFAWGGFFLGLPFMAFMQILIARSGIKVAASAPYVAFMDLATALIFAPFLQNAASRSTDLVGRALSWAPLRYVGKISYGVYIFHYFLVPACQNVFRRMGWNMPDRGLATFCICTALAVALASISWHVLESPLNGLKRHFQFGQASSASSRRESLPEAAQAA